MKFRDPKTGEVFEDIHQAKDVYCMGKDCVSSCALMSNAMLCYQWVEDYPAEAARLMGLEVVEEKEEPTMGQANQMEQSTKPRICEVEYGDCDGCLYEDKRGVEYPCSVCSLAYSSQYVSKPRFTEEEVAVLRHMSSAGVVSIEKKAETHLYWDGVVCGGVMVVPAAFLPSLRPGQAVKLEEIIGAAP